MKMKIMRRRIDGFHPSQAQKDQEEPVGKHREEAALGKPEEEEEERLSEDREVFTVRVQLLLLLLQPIKEVRLREVLDIVS